MKTTQESTFLFGGPPGTGQQPTRLARRQFFANTALHSESLGEIYHVLKKLSILAESVTWSKLPNGRALVAFVAS
jgi:hypothetical protein